MSVVSECAAETFVRSDVLGQRRLARLYDWIGVENARQRVGLVAAIIVPLLLFWYVTSHEHRFQLNSVSEPGMVDGKEWRILGLSFVGDPMVWGYTILVPCLVAVLGVATQRTLELINTASAKATAGWRADQGESGFHQAVRDTCDIWKMHLPGSPGIRWGIRVLPWILAALMWGYNTVTCGLHDTVFGYPYTSAHVTLIPVMPPTQPQNGTRFDGKNVAIVPAVKTSNTTRELERAIPLRKWDCEPGIAPRSFWLSRVWTLLYYCSLPFLLREIVLLVWGATHFLRAGERWEKSHDDREPSLSINPFESDGFGGLGALAEAAIIYCYCVSIPAALLGLSFFKEGMPAAWHDYLLMALYVPLGIWLALTPVVEVHRAIVGSKNRLLSAVAAKMDALSQMMLHMRIASRAEPDTKMVEDERQAYSRLFADVKQMKEWPFDVVSTARIGLSIAAPWLPAVIKEMASGLLGLAGHPGS